MSESIFRVEDGRYVPTDHARGPWDPGALHGGAAAALMVGALEQEATAQPVSLPVARLSFEFLRPIPMAPLTLGTRVVRPGRRVQGLEAELHDGDALVCRASALRTLAVPEGLPAIDVRAEDAPAGPGEGRPVTFALDGSGHASFAATAMEMRWIRGEGQLGPALVWMRLRHPVVPGQRVTALMRCAAAADFGNGVSAALPWKDFLFINADLTIQLHRAPVAEWIALDARTRLSPGGTGLAESVLHDERGPVGRALQSLIVQRR